MRFMRHAISAFCILLLYASFSSAQVANSNSINAEHGQLAIKLKYPLIGCDSHNFKSKPRLQLTRVYEHQGSWVNLNVCIEPTKDEHRQLTAGVFDLISYHEELRMLGQSGPIGIVADGRWLHRNHKSFTASEKNTNGYLKEVGSQYISFEEFLRLAESERMEVVIGKLRFELSPEHRKAIREFAETFSPKP